MKIKCLHLLLILLVSVFAPVAFSTGPTQPPVDTSTLYVGEIAWGPRRADPVRAYDTASGELLFNVYDTLIAAGKPVTDYWGNTWNVHEQHWEFEPSLATNVPDRQEVIMTFNDAGINIEDPVCYWFELSGVWYHISGWVDNNPTGNLTRDDVLYISEHANYEGPMLHCRTWQVLEFVIGNHMTVRRYYYDFNIRTDPAIYFYNSTGDAVDSFDVFDTEYSFERGLVQDQTGSPMWMFYKSLFDAMNSDPWATSPAETYELAYLIEDAIEVVSLDPPILRINMGTAFPDIAFKQIIAQTWGSIVSEEWCVGKGCWNGDIFTDGDADGFLDWWNTTRRLNAPINTVAPENYCGTGPYRVVTTNKTEGYPEGLVIMQRNPDYWKGWPASDRKAYLEFIDIEYIADWTSRKLAFVACQLDVCAVPRVFMFELLNYTDTAYMTPLYPEMITIKNIAPDLSMSAIFYTFTLNSTTDAIFTGRFPDGIPTNFMNNTHIRHAFSYAVNRSRYLKEVWMNEAICRETPNILGLYPDYYRYSPDPPWTYDYSETAMVAELKDAMFTQDSVTKSVWDWGGFRMKIYYYGTDTGRIIAEYIKESFNAINTKYGKNFLIDVTFVDWPTYLDMMETFMMPWWVMGWITDFTDADNWYRPYMHSNGDFSYYQNYSSWNGWTTPGSRTGFSKDILLDLAVKTTDGPERADMYADLDDIYIADCPSMPISQSLGRRWQKYWVKGWYYNALYPSDCYYRMYKENVCWADATGPVAGVPDGLGGNMRDIGYIAQHFGARAPDTSQMAPYDRKWVHCGDYGSGGCDVYGDRIINMRDIGFACAHFCHTTQP